MVARELCLVAMLSLTLASPCAGGAAPVDDGTPQKIRPPWSVPVRQPDAAAPHQAVPFAIPDIYGPGSVLRGGNVYMKITNNGVNGKPLFACTSDVTPQWPLR